MKLTPEQSQACLEELKRVAREHPRHFLLTQAPPRVTYRCNRCKSVFTYTDRGPTSYCIWGGCNGTAERVAS